MHVFIDTNIYLSFYHFSKDQLDALNNVFSSHEHGSAKVHLTRQVCDEFRRNREAKIIDALKRFKDAKFSAQLPSFMKGYEGYEEYGEIIKLCDDLQEKSKTILKKVHDDISSNSLIADRIISEIFSRSKIVETSKEIYDIASMRIALGNPPGKNRSIGDAINWTMLLKSVPDGDILHIISGDGDFYSSLNEESVHPFLEEEWKKEKSSTLYVYRTLTRFMEENYDGVEFSFDKDKDALIEDLRRSNCYAATHEIIGKLEQYPYFSLKKIEGILSAAAENGQVGGIITDRDVAKFLIRVAVPRIAEISDEAHIRVIEEVVEYQKYGDS